MPSKAKVICVCTPSKGKVSMWWARQLADLMRPLNIGYRVMMQRDSIGGEIAETRNSLVCKALNYDTDTTELDSIFWIDDDVLVTRGALMRLYGHQEQVAAGVYFLKGEPTLPLIFPSRLGGTARFVPDHVGKTWGVHSGLTLVRADVYRSLLPHIGKDKYGRPEWYKTERGYKVEGGMLDCGGTEDLYFCNSLEKIGVTPLIDCSKHAFGFHYDLDAEQGYPRPQFDQWAAAKPIVWPGEPDVVWE